jgi:hypothetical protein
MDFAFHVIVSHILAIYHMALPMSIQILFIMARQSCEGLILVHDDDFVVCGDSDGPLFLPVHDYMAGSIQLRRLRGESIVMERV